MGVPFKKIARKDPRKADAVAKFYPQLVTLGDNATLDDIAYVMKEKSSLTLGDIQSVLTNFVEAMITTLYSGQSVNIKNFGVFSLSARTAGVLDVKECTAKNIKADEALRIGLVNSIYPAQELLPAAEKLAGTIAKNAPIAVRACKKAINDGLQVDMDRAVTIEEKLFGSCFETADQKEGMGAFLEKRKHEPYQNR